MAGYRGAWSICGGWAVDGWLGRPTRDHGDVDIAVFQDELDLLFEQLDGWQLIAHDPNVAGNTSERWTGRPLDLPAHIHARSPEARDSLPERLDTPAQQGFGLDIQLAERSEGDWIFSREPRITMPLRRCVRQSAWGLPALVPEALLFYKAGELRRRDKLDFLALLPHLSGGQREWLRNAISLAGHPWLSELS
ncbi:MAG: hypothetical protein KGK07_11800 [Chloroflexota bacterium]|nr:hypothetical protein [Chloroflexota bacterium]